MASGEAGLTDAARACVQVHGDAWIARIFDNEDDFKRLDFKLSEVSSSAPWVKLAAQQMAVKMAGESAEAKMGRYQSMQPQVPAAAAAPRPAPVLQELTPAECAKVQPPLAYQTYDSHCCFFFSVHRTPLRARQHRSPACCVVYDFAAPQRTASPASAFQRTHVPIGRHAFAASGVGEHAGPRSTRRVWSRSAAALWTLSRARTKCLLFYA